MLLVPLMISCLLNSDSVNTNDFMSILILNTRELALQIKFTIFAAMILNCCLSQPVKLFHFIAAGGDHSILS